MPSTKTIILDVESSRVDELLGVLSKRPYIEVVELSREEKAKRGSCPLCERKFPRERTVSMDEKLLHVLISIVDKMKVAKSLVVIGKQNPANLLPPVELPRTIDIDPRAIQKLELLGVVSLFRDGGMDTYHATSEAISFLKGKERLDPGHVVVLDGEIVETNGSLGIDEIKFKDMVARDMTVARAKRMAKELPSETVEFINKGQIRLI